MKSAERIKQFFKDAELGINTDTDEKVFSDVLQAQQNNVKNKPDVPDRWRIIMKSPLVKFAIAAVLIIACLIGMFFWKGTSSGIALADVLARIEQVKAVKFKWTWKITGGDPNKPYNVEMRSTCLTSQEYGSKDSIEALDPNGEWSQSSEKYVLPQKKTMIVIYFTQKIYMCQELKDADVEQIQKENISRDPLSLLKGILKTKYESMGRAIVDGVEVAGFRTTDPNLLTYRGKNQQADIKIWVDVKTLLPVRYDLLASEDVDDMGDRMIQHIVGHDFQWDVSVDAAEFEPPPIPDGYKIKDIFPDLANEETAIQGLKQCVELLGNYPERIALSYLWSGFKKSETPAAMQLKEELKGLTEFEKDYKKMDALKPIRFLNKFYFGLGSKDSAYYGKTVTPKDADKVLMRWKVSDNEYRVIYGDLHAETVSPERLAELEKLVPK
jgi:outer membrane lipoprotein-sorting protein